MKSPEQWSREVGFYWNNDGPWQQSRITPEQAAAIQADARGNLQALASDIAARVPELARESRQNCYTLILGLLEQK